MTAGSWTTPRRRADGGWCLRTGSPVPGLDGEVTAFEERLPGAFRYLVRPSSRAVLSLACTEPYTLGEPSAGGRRVAAVLAGPHTTESVLTMASGDHQGVVLRLDPLQVYALFGAPMRVLRNELVELSELVGLRRAEWVDRFAGTTHWPDRFRLLESVLARMLADGRRPDPLVSRAWRLLSASGGNLPIAVLARRLGVTGRHLARRFDEQVGVSPKTAAQILRYERAVALLRDGGTSIAMVAAATGYSDHAHLTRDVRRFAGIPPRALARSGSH